VERPDAEAGHDRERVWRGLETRMRELIAPLLSEDSDVQYAIEIGEAADIVIETAKRRQADLIVLGLKAPDSYVDRLPWLKAYQIVRHVGCPVLTVRGASDRRGS
jgi:nucleotide-binding universal stress UspA family protein